jgi:26S proteasome regulatory subunit N2
VQLLLTILAKCIDEYIRLRQLQANDAQVTIDSRLERIVEGMFERCFHDRRFKQALGIAVESRRLDKIEYSITHSDNVSEMLLYGQKVSMELVLNKGFRTKV